MYVDDIIIEITIKPNVHLAITAVICRRAGRGARDAIALADPACTRASTLQTTPNLSILFRSKLGVISKNDLSLLIMTNALSKSVKKVL